MAGRAPAGAAERGIRTGSHSGAPSPASPESSRRTDQAEPKVADFGQQPVQRGLISERAANDRLRAVIAEVETLEPGGPMAVEDTVDADLVTRGLSGGAHARAPRGGKPAPGRAAAAPAVRAEAARGAGTSCMAHAAVPLMITAQEASGCWRFRQPSTPRPHATCRPSAHPPDHANPESLNRGPHRDHLPSRPASG